jgi:hypothetical protein
MNDGWLPDLIYLEDTGGDWPAYLEILYDAFLADFVRSRPKWPGKRVALKRYPEYQGKGATFWHMISEGEAEDERIPDLRRCERIRWPRPMMEAFPNRKPDGADRVLWWKSTRRNEERFVLALGDFSYVVVVAERADCVLPWTAFMVGQEHRRRKLEREYEDYWRNHPCP